MTLMSGLRKCCPPAPQYQIFYFFSPCVHIFTLQYQKAALSSLVMTETELLKCYTTRSTIQPQTLIIAIAFLSADIKIEQFWWYSFLCCCGAKRSALILCISPLYRLKYFIRLLTTTLKSQQ